MATTKTALRQPTSTTSAAETRAMSRRGTAGFYRQISRPWFKIGLLLASDLVAVASAHRLSLALTLRLLSVPVANLSPSRYYLFYLPFLASILYLVGGYRNQATRRPERELEVVFKGMSFFFVALVCANFILFRSEGFSRYLLVIWYAVALLLVLAGRFCLRGLYNSLWARGLARQPALLVGHVDHLAAFQQELAVQRYRGYEILGVLSESRSRSEVGHPSKLPAVGGLDDWEEIADRHGIQLLLLSVAADALGNHSRVLEVIRRCQEKGIEVEVYSDLFASSEFKYERDEFSGFFRFYAPPRWSRLTQQAVKIALDRLIGLIGSVSLLFLTPIIALLIKLEDGGPIFYRSAYLGQDTRNHFYWKFRTMCVDADQRLAGDAELRERFEDKFKLETDPRVTRIGRFLRKSSLDEFPQFFNILLGQLSFVGPRTIRQEEGDRYGSLLPRLLSFKPGVTGFWQVMGRQNTTYEERIQMDMFYIEHWSIWLDLVIMTKTVWQVLRADGAY
jgi:exopolysaccharide biosynthesis polyprenyl glycosylphosphotransferase